MSRSFRWLAGLVVMLVLGSLVAACGSTAPSAPSAGDSGAPTAPGILVTPEAMATTMAQPTTANPEVSAGSSAGNVKELTIIWAQWDPANYLQELVNDYEKETGVKVNIVQEPWGTFGDRVFTEFAGKGSSYDLVIGDSQWLGQGATQGHYVELTDVFKSELNGDALAPATVTAYAEYPKGSGKYWAYPTEGDALGWTYRKDLFEDPTEKEAFKAKYGYDLAVPQTLKELRDIAEFFTRPDKNLYGLGIYTQKDYDGITMGYETMLFSYGADWGDPQTYKVDGILNSPEGVQALELYKELYSFAPPGSSNDFFQEVNDKYTSGQVAMAMNFFAFFPGLVNPASNPFAEQTGFFTNPKGPNGDHHTALGGQGMSIVSYISPERQAAAKEFMKWFAKNETQQNWAELGGYTCNAEVLNSEDFQSLTPYNKSFAESMQIVKDFWAVPIYGELLEVVQRELHNYVVGGQGAAKDTLDSVAKQHEEIFKKAGLLK